MKRDARHTLKEGEIVNCVTKKGDFVPLVPETTAFVPLCASFETGVFGAKLLIYNLIMEVLMFVPVLKFKFKIETRFIKNKSSVVKLDKSGTSGTKG